nr:MAG TPA: hypothetical protein [Caudoviricetes sp.]
MKILGKMYYCERCGEQKFIKYIGSRPYRDGMVMHITADGFEAAVGWTIHDNMDLCPDCSKKYNSMMKEFLSCKE